MSLKLGSAVSNSFSIGTAEMRVGSFASTSVCLQLTQANSVGLVDNASISFTAEAVDLFGGFPQLIQDTAIVKQTGNVKASVREFSRRNLDLALSNGVQTTAATDVKTSLVATADVAAAVTSITVVSGTGFNVADVIVIYPTGAPQDVTVTQISAISTNTLTFTLVASLPTVAAYPALTNSGVITYNVFKAAGTAAGNVTQTNYFSFMMVQQNAHTGRPVVWAIWKAANTGTMEQKTSATEYGMLELDIKILQPSGADVSAGGVLNAAPFPTLVGLYPAAVRLAGADI